MPPPSDPRRARPLRLGALALSLLLFQTALPGCFGRFALTRKLYGLNQSVGDEWLRSILTFALVAVPVYGLCAFVDWAFFNSIEFWYGTNPVDGKSADPARALQTAQTRRTSSDGSAVKLELSAGGDVLRVETQRPGEPARVLVLTMRGRDAELRDGAGKLVASLTGAPGGEGSAQIRGADGKLLEEKTPSQLAALEEAVRSGGRALLAELELQQGSRLASAR